MVGIALVTIVGRQLISDQVTFPITAGVVAVAMFAPRRGCRYLASMLRQARDPCRWPWAQLR
jgi:hypothetical protein